MKSTGLFGKNSGRVGGVVYSNYRGEQVVKSYQPQVKNPNTKRQIEQRAKFKLVSQVSAILGSQIKLSFVPSVQKESPRNSFVKKMLQFATYVDNKASLPIEEIVLTNTAEEWIVSIDSTSNNSIAGTLSDRFIGAENIRVRGVFIGYDENDVITLLDVREVSPALDPSTSTLRFSIPQPATQSYSSKRVLLYAYQFGDDSISYHDYETESQEATLEILKKVSSTPILFSATVNRVIPQNV